MSAVGRLGVWVGRVLGFGTIGSMAIVAVGLIVGAFAGVQAPGGGRRFTDVLLAGEPASIVAVGLLALALIPLVELAVAAAAFGRGGERRNLTTTVAVLGLLVAGLATAILAGG